VARKEATGVLAPYGGAVGASLARTDLGGFVARSGPADREPASWAKLSQVGSLR
jgi:hypothetical protein